MYFDQLSGACSTWKLVELLFFSRFQPFLFISKLFQWFHGWNQQKHLKINKKKCFFIFCVLLKAVQHAKGGRLPEGIPQNCLFSVNFLLFSTFFVDFRLISLQKVKNLSEKRQFRCCKHLKAGRNTQQPKKQILICLLIVWVTRNLCYFDVPVSTEGSSKCKIQSCCVCREGSSIKIHCKTFE